MTPERWSQIKDIFNQIAEQPMEVRALALAEACRGDAELQSELEWLLAQDAEAEGFMEGRSTSPSSTPAPRNQLHPGSVLADRYEIAALLGSGGMGEVYEAEDRELGERIAVKVIDPGRSFDGKALGRFRREVQLARRVSHPNVCRVFDLERHRAPDGETVFLTMELVRGETLKQRLERVNRVALPEAQAITVQLCHALEAAHQAGILHRDFKPANVMLVGEGEHMRAVVMDFGIARWMDVDVEGGQSLTSGGAVFGTPAYMSPEQIQGKELNLTSDLYSLGLVLYEMVTGLRPFRSESGWTEAMKRLTENPAPPARLVNSLPHHWNTTILRCLERDPARRFASADKLVLSLQEPMRGRSQLLRIRILMAIAAVLLVCAALAGIFRNRLFLPRIPAQKHIAVIPFSFAGADSANRATAYGLSESLTGNLARLETSNGLLWVVPWAQLRNWTLGDSRHATAALGVNLLMTGQVEKHETGLRLHLALKDAATLKDLRSQTFDVPSGKIVTLEDTLLEKASAMLQIQLPSGTSHSLPVDQTSSPGAYEFYEQGHGYLRHDDSENVDRAVVLLQKALELDPHFAIAYADLAYAYDLKYRFTKNLQWLEQARRQSTQALSLNEGLSPAHLAGGMIAQDAGDLDGAISEFKRALELDPSDDENMRRLALAYDEAGKLLEAENLIKDAIRRNPASWLNYSFLGYFYFRHAQYDQAVPLFQAATDLAPDYPVAVYNLGGAYLALGKYKEAEAILSRAVALKPTPGGYSNLGTAYFHLGKYGEATAAFLKATELTPRDYTMWSNLADAYDMAGDHGRAQQAYQTAIAEITPAIKLRPKDGLLLENMGLYYAKLGQKSEAQAVLAQAMRHPANIPEFFFNAARIYELTGQREQALLTLRAALRAGYSLSEIESDADFSQLRTDSRYPSIAGKPNRNAPDPPNHRISP